MGSKSFCLDLSGDCKCASWLAARTREAGCCIFIPEDCWASGSSKLDLRKDCMHTFRVEHRTFIVLLLVTPKYVLFIISTCININTVSAHLSIVLSHNTLQYPFKAARWSHLNKPSSIRKVKNILQIFLPCLLPLSHHDLHLSQQTNVPKKNRCP